MNDESLSKSFAVTRKRFFKTRYKRTYDIGRKFENIFKAMIIPEFEFLEIEREPRRRDAVVLDKPLLGPTPEPFETVDIYFTRGEPFLMINGKVTIAAEHKRIVRLVPVGVHDVATADSFHGKIKQGFCANVGDDFHTDNSLAFQNAEYRDFTGSAATTRAFSSAAEIALVEFDLAAEQCVGIGRGAQDRMTDKHHCPMYGIIGYGKL